MATQAAARPVRPVGAEAVTPPVRLEDLLQSARRHVWHPYGPMPGRTEPLVVESASGVRLQLTGGGELVDGMSSWWAAIHGYRHPVLDAAAADQLGRMSHVMFGGLTHEPAVRLCERLVAMAPPGLEHVFLCDSGSVSVEVAVKMCLQYWRSAGRPGKRQLLTWRGGYHGDTFMAMSVCDPEGGMPARRDGGGQGPDRRVHVAGRRVVHPGGGVGGRLGLGARAGARAHLYGQPAGLRGRPGLAVGAGGPALVPGRLAGLGGPARRGPGGR